MYLPYIRPPIYFNPVTSPLPSEARDGVSNLLTIMTPKVTNLITRTLTGVLFVAVLIGCILYSPLSFGLLFMLITALCIWEFCTLVNRHGGVRVNPLICTVAGAYLFAAFFGYCSGITPVSVFLPYLLSLLYIWVNELYLKHPNPISNWAYSLMSQLYIALPFGLLNVLGQVTDPTSALGVRYMSILPLSVFLFLWSSDTGAYCVGSLIGKRRLFPSISPKKSWEGSIGGGLLAIGVSQVLAHYFTLFTPLQWAGMAITVTVFGTWGDLVESLIKRTLGIKDSGNILPGHGGMLDRFDSSLLAIPAVVLYVYTLTLFP